MSKKPTKLIKTTKKRKQKRITHKKGGFSFLKNNNSPPATPATKDITKQTDGSSIVNRITKGIANPITITDDSLTNAASVATSVTHAVILGLAASGVGLPLAGGLAALMLMCNKLAKKRLESNKLKETIVDVMNITRGCQKINNLINKTKETLDFFMTINIKYDILYDKITKNPKLMDWKTNETSKKFKDKLTPILKIFKIGIGNGFITSTDINYYFLKNIKEKKGEILHKKDIEFINNAVGDYENEEQLYENKNLEKTNKTQPVKGGKGSKDEFQKRLYNILPFTDSSEESNKRFQGFLFDIIYNYETQKEEDELIIILKELFDKIISIAPKEVIEEFGTEQQKEGSTNIFNRLKKIQERIMNPEEISIDIHNLLNKMNSMFMMWNFRYNTKIELYKNNIDPELWSILWKIIETTDEFKNYMNPPDIEKELTEIKNENIQEIKLDELFHFPFESNVLTLPQNNTPTPTTPPMTG